MINWGSIPDWLSVAIALVALMAFFIAERDRLVLKRRNSGNRHGNDSFLDGIDKEQAKSAETSIDIRAELYSRILLGTILGGALSPIFAGVYAHVATTVVVLLAFTLSSLLTFIYFRAYSGWKSVFVHWAERLAISFVGFSVIAL